HKQAADTSAGPWPQRNGRTAPTLAAAVALAASLHSISSVVNLTCGHQPFQYEAIFSLFSHSRL
nr:hypothetical protein [Tanacetum cinerariifolium]